MNHVDHVGRRFDDHDQRRAPLADTYGSDKAGLVCAYAFQPGVPGRAIDAVAAAAALLADAAVTTEFLWLHFSLSTAASAQWLRQHVTLPVAFYESLGDTTSTRVQRAEDALRAIFTHATLLPA